MSQKDPQPDLSRRSIPAKPEGRQILMDSAIVANPVTARNGAAPGVCSSCPPKLSGEGGCRLSIISCLAPYANF
ncbi:MAG: hypothetical protein WC637_02080 [Victivallales bacterium]